MKLTFSKEKLENIQADALVITLYQGEKPAGKMLDLSRAISSSISEAIELGDFKGRLYEVASFYTHGKIKSKRVFVVGMGKKSEFEPRYFRNIAGSAGRKAVKMGIQTLAFYTQRQDLTEHIIEGIGLALYQSDIYKSKNKNIKTTQELILVGEVDQKIFNHSLDVVKTVNWVRGLINEPANLMTPKQMVEEAKKIASENQLELEILNEEQAAKKGMGAFVGIAKGSSEPSYMVTFKYKGKGKDTLAVVGKGITFDSGGISIKPSEKMHEMKMDMAGAASVFGFMKLVGKMRPKTNVLGITPLTENLPGGNALKPGDILTSLNGKTIEVLNTDAEGRVVLADALAYAVKLGATHIVDLATLTGAVIVALGNDTAAILGKPELWTEKIKSSAELSGESLWELPIYPEHKELLKSDIADIANIPPSRGAGVIAGAVFLKEFVPDKISWAHLDIAGTAWVSGEKPYLSKGATGFGVRTLDKLLGLLENK